MCSEVNFDAMMLEMKVMGTKKDKFDMNVFDRDNGFCGIMVTGKLTLGA